MWSKCKVRVYCEFILQNLEKLIHPQKENLVFTDDSLQHFYNETVVKFQSILPINDVISSMNTNDSESNGTNNDKLQDDGIESIQAEVAQMLWNYSSIHRLNNNETFKESLLETFELYKNTREDVHTSINLIRDFNEIVTFNAELSAKNKTKRDEISINALDVFLQKSMTMELLQKTEMLQSTQKIFTNLCLKNEKLTMKMS